MLAPKHDVRTAHVMCHFDLQKPTPWIWLYAGDVMPARDDKGELEQQAEAWCDARQYSGSS